MRSLAAAALLFALPAVAQDAVEILRKVDETYRALKSYDFEHVQRSQGVSGISKHDNESRSRVMGLAPGRFRREDANVL